MRIPNLKGWLDFRVLTYGVVLPAALYLTAATVLADRRASWQQDTEQIRTGKEMAAVFFTSSTCAGNSYPDFREIVRTINRDLASRGLAEGFAVRRVGVTLDWDVKKGWDFVGEFGPFDELVVGNNWLNTAVLRYMLRDMPGPLTIPQLVLLEREVRNEPGEVIEVLREEVLLRLVGSDQIAAWLEAGIPFAGYSPKPSENETGADEPKPSEDETGADEPEMRPDSG